MAYADARHTQRNVSTVALVALFEVGLGLALIAGLSINYTIKRDENIKTTDFTLPPPPEKIIDPPKPNKEVTKLVEKAVVIPDAVIDLGTGTLTLTDDDKGLGGDDDIGTAVFPTATPSPAPSFTPIRAKPRGNPANWVTENDYPTSEIRGEHQGRTGFRVSVDAAGKVSDCKVTSSSGWPVLDATTCEKLARRAKFEAAIDSTGARTEGFYVGTVNWRLPED